MATNGKAGHIVHRETFQNANQIVEVLIRTKPKTMLSAVGGKLKPFTRDCHLRNKLEKISEEKSDIVKNNSKPIDCIEEQTIKDRISTLQRRRPKEKKLTVEVSKKKRESKSYYKTESADATWSDILKSYNTTRDCDSCDGLQDSAFDDADQYPPRSNKSEDSIQTHSKSIARPNLKDCGIQTSRYHKSNTSRKSSKSYNLERPSFTDQETTVPHNMQVLQDNIRRQQPPHTRTAVADGTHQEGQVPTACTAAATHQQPPLSLSSYGNPAHQVCALGQARLRFVKN